MFMKLEDSRRISATVQLLHDIFQMLYILDDSMDTQQHLTAEEKKRCTLHSALVLATSQLSKTFHPAPRGMGMADPTPMGFTRIELSR